MAGAFCTTILLVMVAGATVFRHPLVTANPSTSCQIDNTSAVDGCNNSAGRVKHLECRILNHIKGILTLKRILTTVCSKFCLLRMLAGV